MLKNRIGLLVLPMAMVVASAVYAGGGTKVIQDVSITSNANNSPVTSIAVGAIHAARMNVVSNNQGSQTKEIGCQIFAFPAPTPDAKPDVSLFCLATRATGTPPQFACHSSDPALIAVAANINGDSVVTFEAVPGPITAPNLCLSIFVENSSKYWQYP